MVLLIISIFVTGYIAIAFENVIKVDKTAAALITGILCWTIYIGFSRDKELISKELAENLGDFAGILFFLMGAMTIVEIIDAHDGFTIITEQITQNNKRKLLWIISLITFFLSSILDNLTTAIVMASLLQKIVSNPKERLYFVGMIVVAANAGGAWSPIGDVTTTMLWMGGQITAAHLIKMVFLPSIVSLFVPLLISSTRIKGKLEISSKSTQKNSILTKAQQVIVLFSGFVILLLVPVFKSVTHLPPYMGILIGLAILWIIAKKIGDNKEETHRHRLSPAYALSKIDSSSILFFLGILLCIAVLQRVGILTSLAHLLDTQVPNKNAIVVIMGLLSSIVDNVPLMAAAQGMYPLSEYPPNDGLWVFLAYCTGTGGSILIIGSAAGIAVMGIAKIEFFWYLKNISWIALIGFLAGAGTFILMQKLS